MRKVCAWCKKNMETVPSANNSDGIISHGICDECVKRQVHFLAITIPVAVVDVERNQFDFPNNNLVNKNNLV